LRTWILTTLGEDFLNPGLLAEVALGTDEFDLQATLLGHALCILAGLVFKRLGKPRIIEYPDVEGTQMRAHPGAVTDARYDASDDHAVEAGDYTVNLVRVALD